MRNSSPLSSNNGKSGTPVWRPSSRATSPANLSNRRLSTGNALPAVPKAYAHVQAKVTTGPYGFVKNTPSPKAPSESLPKSTPAPTSLDSPCLIPLVDFSVVDEVESPHHARPASLTRHQKVSQLFHEEELQTPVKDVAPQSRPTFSPGYPGNLQGTSSGFPFQPSSPYSTFSSNHHYASPVSPLLGMPHPLTMQPPVSTAHQFGYDPYATMYNPFVPRSRIHQLEAEIFQLRLQIEQNIPVPSKSKVDCAVQTDSPPDLGKEFESRQDGPAEDPKPAKPPSPSPVAKPPYTDRSPKENFSPHSSSKEVTAKVAPPPNIAVHSGDASSRTPLLPMNQDAQKPPALESMISVLCQDLTETYRNKPQFSSRSAEKGSPAASVIALDVSLATANYLERNGLSPRSAGRQAFRKSGNLMESVLEIGEE